MIIKLKQNSRKAPSMFGRLSTHAVKYLINSIISSQLHYWLSGFTTLGEMESSFLRHKTTTWRRRRQKGGSAPPFPRENRMYQSRLPFPALASPPPNTFTISSSSSSTTTNTVCGSCLKLMVYTTHPHLNNLATPGSVRARMGCECQKRFWVSLK